MGWGLRKEINIISHFKEHRLGGKQTGTHESCYPLMKWQISLNYTYRQFRWHLICYSEGAWHTLESKMRWRSRSVTLAIMELTTIVLVTLSRWCHFDIIWTLSCYGERSIKSSSCSVNFSAFVNRSSAYTKFFVCVRMGVHVCMLLSAWAKYQPVVFSSISR